MVNEKKIVLTMDLVYSFIILPIILLLIPTEKILENNPIIFVLLLSYIMITYFIHRKFNILIYIIKRQFWKVILVLTITILSTYLIVASKYSGDVKVVMNDNVYVVVGDMRTRSVWFMYLISTSFGLISGLMIELFRQIINMQAIETEKNKAEIALYKSQINPHFMFNTLNTLYGLFIMKSEKAEEYFVKFSDILKYLYVNVEKDKILIEEEVNYIRKYIDLQSFRLGKNTTIKFNHNIDDNSVMIPSMILITFVENVFKYGISSVHDSTISIDLRVENEVLTFSTTNNVFAKRNKQQSSGIGIENCRKRLDLLYPNRYSLSCNEKNNIFKTLLTIEL